MGFVIERTGKWDSKESESESESRALSRSFNGSYCHSFISEKKKRKHWKSVKPRDYWAGMNPEDKKLARTVEKHIRFLDLVNQYNKNYGSSSALLAWRAATSCSPLQKV